MTFVFSFAHEHHRPPTECVDLLGRAGAVFAELTSVLGLPVAPGFTVSTEACRAYRADGWSEALAGEIAEHVTRLEAATGRTFGAATDRLLVSVGPDVATVVGMTDDPMGELCGAIEAAFKNGHHVPTAVDVQVIARSDGGSNSAAGFGFTRNATTGASGPSVDFLVDATHADIAEGTRTAEHLDSLAAKFPTAHAELLAIFERLESHYRDMCDTTFSIDQGKLWLLHAGIGKRTGVAAMKMAVAMTGGSDSSADSWTISRHEALMRITETDIDQVLHPQFEGQGKVLTTGLGASPGAAAGHVYFTADEAADASDLGIKVILVRNETSPEDVHGMMVSEGILTTRGGLVSHAAVVARGWGTPAVVGAEAVKIEGKQFSVGDVVVKEGDVISLDGATGEVILGELSMTSAEPPPEFDTILAWADEVRAGKLAVRANADNGPDAANARQFGAEGIGLCRTEHMFLGDDRLPIVRAMILASTPEDEAAALEALRVVQKTDFKLILEAMDGLPVTVRLLDPPLHEFLPRVEDLRIKKATDGLSAEEEALLVAAESWAEFNPMLGTRGVRLGVVKPGLYAMQVRALMEAAIELRNDGRNPIVEVMIPLTVAREELALARGWVESAIAEAMAGEGQALDVTIGTMIETPRAALRADEIAEEADFFSFGTNDLTQMTFGFSRDDVESRMMPAYLQHRLLARNPFDTIDKSGVGELVQIAATRGRATKPGLKLGVCGEHGGDPESIDLFYNAGLNYVSCSPFRVPVARLAAAQAIIRRSWA